MYIVQATIGVRVLLTDQPKWLTQMNGSSKPMESIEWINKSINDCESETQAQEE